MSHGAVGAVAVRHSRRDGSAEPSSELALSFEVHGSSPSGGQSKQRRIQESMQGALPGRDPKESHRIIGGKPSPVYVLEGEGVGHLMGPTFRQPSTSSNSDLKLKLFRVRPEARRAVTMTNSNVIFSAIGSTPNAPGSSSPLHNRPLSAAHAQPHEEGSASMRLRPGSAPLTHSPAVARTQDAATVGERVAIVRPLSGSRKQQQVRSPHSGDPRRSPPAATSSSPLNALQPTSRTASSPRPGTPASSSVVPSRTVRRSLSYSTADVSSGNSVGVADALGRFFGNVTSGRSKVLGLGGSAAYINPTSGALTADPPSIFHRRSKSLVVGSVSGVQPEATRTLTPQPPPDNPPPSTSLASVSPNPPILSRTRSLPSRSGYGRSSVISGSSSAAWHPSDEVAHKKPAAVTPTNEIVYAPRDISSKAEASIAVRVLGSEPLHASSQSIRKAAAGVSQDMTPYSIAPQSSRENSPALANEGPSLIAKASASVCSQRLPKDVTTDAAENPELEHSPSTGCTKLIGLDITPPSINEQLSHSSPSCSDELLNLSCEATQAAAEETIGRPFITNHGTSSKAFSNSSPGANNSDLAMEENLVKGKVEVKVPGLQELETILSPSSPIDNNQPLRVEPSSLQPHISPVAITTAPNLTLQTSSPSPVKSVVLSPVPRLRINTTSVQDTLARLDSLSPSPTASSRMAAAAWSGPVTSPTASPSKSSKGGGLRGNLTVDVPCSLRNSLEGIVSIDMPSCGMGAHARMRSTTRTQGLRSSRESLSVQASGEILNLDLFMQPPHTPHTSTEAMSGLLQECQQLLEDIEIGNEWLESLVEGQRSYWRATRSHDGDTLA
ncbi:hypothetical protein CEUSTIGMA_g381.t1 [Chlamydomonas eustigma]|uniref:Uncharacterized protein n=1 Tax=Chlamydomonas eustigma TaxID=1157962 RepID=A0A250WQE7_9CHLO|nr:hypothetical protein CEUSTIGMA_g381.t1 [Chlamydomonas eustigma]|eukprot:GAX72926.1 hypothetical protein CEUSTIGMA_g381.t1 [Chlamydomonas eustigma]